VQDAALLVIDHHIAIAVQDQVGRRAGMDAVTRAGQLCKLGVVVDAVEPSSAVVDGCGSQERGLTGRDILVDLKEVVRVVLSLQGLESDVFLRPVRLSNSIGTLVAQEVHIDALVPRL
jgi:hypothetical protein